MSPATCCPAAPAAAARGLGLRILQQPGQLADMIDRSQRSLHSALAPHRKRRQRRDFRGIWSSLSLVLTLAEMQLNERLRDLVAYLRRQRQELLSDPASAITPKRVSAATLGAGFAAAALYGLRKQGRAPAVAEVPLSTLMQQVESGLVRTATLAAGACAYRLKDDLLLHARLVPSETRQLVALMHRHGVEFRAVGPSGWKSAVVLLLPFAYLGLCGWLLWRVTSDLHGGNDAVPEPANAPESERITFDDIGGLAGPKAQVCVIVALHVVGCVCVCVRACVCVCVCVLFLYCPTHDDDKFTPTRHPPPTPQQPARSGTERNGTYYSNKKQRLVYSHPPVQTNPLRS